MRSALEARRVPRHLARLLFRTARQRSGGCRERQQPGRCWRLGGAFFQCAFFERGLAAVCPARDVVGQADAVICSPSQTGANGILPRGSVGLATKNAVWSRISPERLGSSGVKATNARAIVPQ